jgi:hypothetical protein
VATGPVFGALTTSSSINDEPDHENTSTRDVVSVLAWIVFLTSVALMAFAHLYVMVIPGAIAYVIAKVARYGDAAYKGRCPYCRGRVKAKAIARKKCVRVVAEPAGPNA